MHVQKRKLVIPNAAGAPELCCGKAQEVHPLLQFLSMNEKHPEDHKNGEFCH